MSRRSRDYGYGATPRELEVERHYEAGLEPGEIAERMNITVPTVKVIISRLYPKPASEDAAIRNSTISLGLAIDRVYPEGIPA